MTEEELKAEAVRLLDTFGPWTVSGVGWWIATGIGPNPSRELVAAVKIEQTRRLFEASPPAPGAGGIVSISYAPGQFDERS